MSGTLKICEFLETLYVTYHRREYVGLDPVGFLYNYPSVQEREIVAFVASFLAFGRVQQIHAKVSLLLDLMRPSPRVFIEEFSKTKWAHFKFSHRFIKELHIISLWAGMQSILRRWQTLGRCFQQCWREGRSDVRRAIGVFRSYLLLDNSDELGMFIPDPDKKSSCKRWALLLRWMSRCDEIDPGGWDFISPSSIIVPVDIHLYRVARMLGLTKRQTATWETALEITEALKACSPEDPVRYDFALTRWSMNGMKALDVTKSLS